jgi:hypothetical protein
MTSRSFPLAARDRAARVHVHACRRSAGARARPAALAKRLRSLAVVLGLVHAAGAPAQAPTRLENWIYYQGNENGSVQWKYEPHLYMPFALGSGWSFTQRVDVPLVYTDDKGSANPKGDWGFGVGNALIEEIFESPPVADGVRLRASARFVFPTGKAAPFGQGQYQWAPGAGAIVQGPRGITFEPYVRYFQGFAATASDVKLVREWQIYPAATFALSEGLALQLYPENPLRYNRANGTWFVPLDLMLAWRLDRRWQLGAGGAYALGNPRDAPYRFIVDARITVAF